MPKVRQCMPIAANILEQREQIKDISISPFVIIIPFQNFKKVNLACYVHLSAGDNHTEEYFSSLMQKICTAKALHRRENIIMSYKQSKKCFKDFKPEQILSEKIEVQLAPWTHTLWCP